MKHFLLFIIFILLGTALCFGSSKHKRLYARHTIGGFAVANTTGLGAGLRYEQFLNERENLSLSLPFERCSMPTLSSNGANINTHMYIIDPGLRFYPAGSSGVVRFSTGVGIIIGFGTQPTGRYVNSKSDLTGSSIGGIMLCNALTFHFSPAIQAFLGLDFGLGSDSDYRVQSAGIAQLSLGIGYRF